MEKKFKKNYLTKINLPYIIYELNEEIFSLFETSQYLINLLGVNNYKSLNNLRNMSIFLHQKDKDNFQNAIEKVVKTKKNASLKILFYNLIKKEYFPFKIELSIYKWSNNKQILLHFIALEKKLYLKEDSLINAGSKLESLPDFEETILNKLPILVNIIDLKTHKILLINKACLKHFNRDGLDFHNKICYKFLYNSDKPCKNCDLNNPITEQFKKLYCQDKKTTLNMISYKIDWYGKPALLQFAYDISDLEEKNKVIKELKAIQKARNNFSARISHDLRTPMNAIINFAQFGTNESKDSKDKEYFTEIEKASNYMLELLNDILNFDKIELKKLIINKKVTNLRANLNNIHSVLGQKAQGKNIEFTTNINTISPNTYIITDALKEKQLFSNILSNAIKYTPKGGAISWNVKIERASNSNLYQHHIISDNGIGMSEDFQKKMFLPFICEKNKFFLTEESSGLGLAIVKSIVTALKGEISCQSKIGVGTTFKIKLPCKLASKESIKKYKETKVKTEKLIIKNSKVGPLNLLVCEDNLVNQKILKMILEKEGYKVTLANNGKEGVELAKKNKYSLIIMDIKMPVLNGLEAAKAIRLFNKQIPIIALSANVFEADIKKSKEAGMNVHLSKPINREKLFFNINRLTNLNELHLN